MKKTLFLITAILGANSSNAQLKVKAGTNISSINGFIKAETRLFLLKQFNYEDRTKSKFGLYIGAGYSININENLSLTPEIIYSQMGAAGDGYYNNVKESYTHNYITLPIFIEYKIVDKLKIGAGLQFNYLLKAKFERDFQNVPVEFQNTIIKEIDETDFYYRLNYGITFGASYTFLRNFSIEARYYLGLNNMLIEDKQFKSTEVTTTTEMKNQAFQIGLAYKFN